MLDGPGCERLGGIAVYWNESSPAKDESIVELYDRQFLCGVVHLHFP